MPKYLINDKEAEALRKIVADNKANDNLDADSKLPRPASNFPFRFKLLEAMGASTANKASAAIYFFGDTTANIYDTDDVVDNDASYFANASSGDKGVCLASSAYHISYMGSSSLAATDYMCLASTDYAITDATIVVDTLIPMNGVGTTLTTLTANNIFKWSVVDNANCYIKYNANTSLYNLLQTECTAI